MEYVYGTAEVDGMTREDLRVIGGPKLGEGEYLTTVREYDDNAVADRRRIGRRYLTAEDRDGTKYGFYTVSEYYCCIDRAKVLSETKVATEITSIALTKTSGIGRMTAGEHKNLPEEWQTGVSYKVGQYRRYGEKLYRCVQQHAPQMGWESDEVASLWSVTVDPAKEWLEWNQPLEAHDAYVKGARASHNGKHWVDGADANVWEPGVSGWSEAKE